MSNLINILKKLKSDYRRRGDPTIGIEYNKFNTDYLTSSHIYSADIARTPRIVSNDLEFIDVMAEAGKVNSYTGFLNQKMRYFNGRKL
jgi:hypothetical protein